MKIVIAGPPKVGKTTLANHLGVELGIPVMHTDDWVGIQDWSGGSLHMANRLEESGPFIIEGVTAVRGLRKFISRNAKNNKKPCDIVYYRSNPYQAYSSEGQASMAMGIHTIWSDIRTDLMNLGVEIREF